MHFSFRSLSPDQILNRIRDSFRINHEEFQRLATQTDVIVSGNPTLRSLSDLTFLHHIQDVHRALIKRAGFISPKVLFVSDKIKSLCRLRYLHEDGRIDPCGGITKNYLACSPYAPAENEMKTIFQKGNIFCFIQAEGLTDLRQQKYLNDILALVEDYFIQNGIDVVMSFAAGPCRLCDKCAGQFGEECYEPEKKRFSMEACGIDVDWAMKMMALKTNEDSWKIRWLKNFRKGHNTPPFRSVLGILLLLQ